MSLHTSESVVSAVSAPKASSLRRYAPALAIAALLLGLTCPASAVNTDPAGGSQSYTNMQPFLGLNYVIASQGIFPSRNIPVPDGDLSVNNTLFGGQQYLATVSMFAGNFAPRGWYQTEGQILSIAQNTALFSLLGTTYGGDGRSTFGLPDLRGRTPIHSGGGSTGPGLTPRPLGQKTGQYITQLNTSQMPSHNHTIGVANQTTFNAGSSLRHNNMQPSLALNYCIALQGLFPSRNIPVPDGDGGDADLSSDPFIAEVAMFAGNFAPRGWAYANGQILQISSNQALFSLLGTTYGGDGRTTFALPDMRGRTAIGTDTGPGFPEPRLGQKSGVENVTLTTNQIPSHSHTVSAQPNRSPTSNTGGSQSHTNMQPTMGMNYIISLVGLYPSRSIPVPDGDLTEAEVSGGDADSASPMLGEITMFAGNFAPRGWALCEGQLLPISQNTALFSIMGTMYGGDGRTTFALPDMRGRVGIHEGRGPGLPSYRIGQEGGTEDNTLTIGQLPSHFHGLRPLIWDGTDPEQWTSVHWNTGPVAPVGGEEMVVDSGMTIVSTDQTGLPAGSLSIARSAPGGIVHVDASGRLQISGQVDVNEGGVLRVDGLLSTSMADIRGGTLTNRPRNGGISVIHGSVAVGNGGTLAVDAVGATSDTFTSTGFVTLDADAGLEVAIYGGGDTFKAGTYTLIIAAIGLSGEFDKVTDLNAYVSAGPNEDGLIYNTAGTVTLTLDMDLHPADGNLDGATDVSDRIIWSNNNFKEGTTFQTGDYNGDGATDVSDRILWNQWNFTEATPPPAPTPVPVPEPATVSLVLLALAVAPLRRRRRA